MNTVENPTLWPPEYSIKYSARAKRITLTLSPTKGLVFTLPPQASVETLPSFLEEKKSWILKHLPALLVKKAITETLPEKIELQALGEVWSVDYREVCTRSRIISRPGGQLVIMRNAQSDPKKMLEQWLKTKAKQAFPLWLKHISEETGLAYTSVNIRGQKHRWGSCSKDGDISLNYKLLFLPERLVRHTLIHELCHTVHLNHSIKFWRLLAKFDEHWEKHSKEVYKANHYVPLWLEG